MQGILIFITAFILAADQFAGLHILCRPLVGCSLIGMILGNPAAGLSCGAAAEVLQSAADYTGKNEWTRPAFLLSGITAVILAAKGNLSAAEAIGSTAGFAAVGMMINALIMNLSTLLLPAVRKAAASGSTGKIAVLNFLPLVILSAVYGAAACWFYNNSSADITRFAENYGWIGSAAAAAGSLMACIGLAVLMRNIQLKNMTGALFAGAAAAVLCLKSGMGQEGLLVCVMVAFAAGAYDFSRNKQTKTEKSVKGGGQKWW